MQVPHTTNLDSGSGLPSQPGPGGSGTDPAGQQLLPLTMQQELIFAFFPPENRCCSVYNIPTATLLTSASGMGHTRGSGLRVWGPMLKTPRQPRCQGVWARGRVMSNG